MIIHVVQSGDTSESIANSYGISEEWLVIANGIVNPAILVIGDTYVILYPESTHTVVEGDTLESISYIYKVTVMELLRNNAHLSNREKLYIGETIVIHYEDVKHSRISINSYTLPTINRDILRKTLPYLTYLTIYSHEITVEGELLNIDDKEVIEISKEYGVAPIMYLTLEGPNEEHGRISHTILKNEDIQNSLISNTLNILTEKSYIGVNFDTVYVLPSDRSLYTDFLVKFSHILREKGFLLFNTLTPNSFDLVVGGVFSSFDSFCINTLVNISYLLPFEITILLKIPTGSIPFCNIREILEYTNKLVPANQLALGISTTGYKWEMPYIEGISQGEFISNHNVVQLARSYRIPIHFDEYTQSSFLNFFENELEFLIFFKDARSINTSLNLATSYNINNIAVWSIMEYFYDIWLIINSQFEIEKIL